MNSKIISVVVPTHNRAHSLIRLLNSFNKQKEFPKEIIIVNDGSDDRTQEILKKWEVRNHGFIPIVFNNPDSQGPAVARNIGIQLASGDAIAFTDDDCIVHPLWIKVINNSKIWKISNKIAGIGGKVIPFRNGIVSEYFAFHRILEPPRYNQYLVTANACYLKEKLNEVNGFDETHKYPGGEDNGLSFKLANLGYEFGFEKKMIIKHDYRTSIYAFIKTFYRYGKGCAEITHKYLNNLSRKNIRENNMQNLEALLFNISNKIEVK